MKKKTPFWKKDFFYFFLFPLTIKIIFEFIYMTCKKKIIGKENLQFPCILCFWHGRQMPLVRYFKNRDIYIISSTSRAGLMQQKILKKFGYKIIEGSSDKNPTQTILSALKILKKNNTIAVAADGPKGPERIIKPGIIYLASKSQKPIILIGVEISNKKVFEKAWDKYNLPVLFAEIKIRFSEPVYIEKNINKEKVNFYCDKIKNDMDLINSINKKNKTKN